MLFRNEVPLAEDPGDHRPLSEIWKSYCPVEGRKAEYRSDHRYHELARLDTKVHEMEEKCLGPFAMSGSPGRELLKQPQYGVRIYERDVKHLLDKADSRHYH